MAKYKLVYFNLRGKAEAIRLLFAYAQVEYEDVRLTYEEWPEWKPKTPYGQVPVIEVDGKQMAESIAIARYLGKEFGLVPESNFDQGTADALADLTQDMFYPVKSVLPVRVQDEASQAEREALKPKVLEENVYPFLDKVEAVLANSSNGWLVGDKICWVDFLYFNYAELFIDIFGKDVFQKYEHLKKHYKAIKGLPQIAEYLEKRPVTPL